MTLSASLSVEEAYNQAAPYYDDWKWQRFWRSHEHPLVLERIRSFATNPVALLDVGCGTGAYLHVLKDCCSSMTGVDISEGMLTIARARLPSATFHRCDAAALPCAENSFDVILCARMLSHVADPAPVIAEMVRALHPGGILILSNIDADHPYENTNLPMPSASLTAPTFKHRKADIDAITAEQNLAPQGTVYIGENGMMENPVLGAPIAWVSVFSKAA
jgi:ubiquinone/menaquinone biosynthesis C-methylase UbiE